MVITDPGFLDNTISNIDTVKPKGITDPGIVSNLTSKISSSSKPIEKKQSLVWKILDDINRPQYAIANTILDAVDGGDFNAVQSLWHGLKLEDKTSIADTLTEIGWEPTSKVGKIGKFTVGLLGDILTDPLTYAGGIGLVKRGAKAIDTISDASKVIDKTSDAVRLSDDALENIANINRNKELITNPVKPGELLKRGSTEERVAKAARVSGDFSDTKPVLTAEIPFTSLRGEIPLPKVLGDIVEKTSIAGTKAWKSLRDDVPFVSDALNQFTEFSGLFKLSNKIRPKGQDPNTWIYQLIQTEQTKNLEKKIANSSFDVARQLMNDLDGLGLKKGQSVALQKNIIDIAEKNPTFYLTKTDDVKKQIYDFGKSLGLDDVHINNISDDIFDIANKFVKTTNENNELYKTIGELSNLTKEERNARIEDIVSELKKSNDVTKGISDSLISGVHSGINLKQDGVELINRFIDYDIEKRNVLLKTLKELGYDKEIKDLGYVTQYVNPKVPKDLIDDLGLKDFNTKTKSSLERSLVSYNDPDVGDSLLSLNTGIVFKNGKKIDRLNKEEIIDLFINNRDKIANATIKEKHNHLGYEVFSTSLPELIAIHGKRVGQMVSADRYFKELKKIGKKDIGGKNLLPKGYRKTNIEELEDIALPEAIAYHAEKTYNLLTNDKEIGKLVQIFDELQNRFKGINTFMNPAFHTANAISNLVQNSLAGVGIQHIPEYIEGYKIAFNKVFNPSALTDAQKAFLKETDEFNLSRVGHMTGDIEHSIKESMMNMFQLLKHGKIYKGISKPGAIAGQIVEDGAKYAHYMAKRKEGLSGFDASRSVKKYLFDYEDLTEMEKKYMKRTLPFYCVPDTSKILTINGWKSVYDLNIGDLSLSYNIEKNCLEWKPVLDIAIFDYNEPILKWKNKRHSLMFTHEHKWVVKTNNQKTKHSYGIYDYQSKTFLIEGRYLNSNHHIVTSAKYISNESILSVEESRLLGWILTDGYFRFRGNHCETMIYQHPKKFIEEVKLVAGGIPREPHPYTGTICVPVLTERINKLKPYLINRNKRDNNWIDIVTQLSTECLEAMYDAMYKADGLTSKHRKQDSFYSQLDGVSDTFEVLATMLGKRVTKNNRGFNIERNISIGIKDGNIKEELYNGKVWCPSTENNTWIMKQGKVITITGNTFTRKNIPLQLEALIKSPAKQSKIVKLKNNVEVAEPEGEEGLPPWVRDIMPIYVGKSGDQHAYISLARLMPISTLESFSNPVKEMLSMFTPVLKTPVEQGLNQDFFLGRKLSEQNKFAEGFSPLSGTGFGERDFYGTRIGGRLEHLVSILRPIMEIEKLVGNKYNNYKWTDKLVNFAFSGKLYKFSEQDLINNFSKEASNNMNEVNKQLNTLRFLYKKYPERRKDLSDDIKLLSKLLIKERQYSKKEISRFKQGLREQ